MGVTASFQGSLAAPTAGAIIASLTGIARGFYRVVCVVKFTAGSPAAADVDNFQLLVDGVAVGQVPAVAALNTEDGFQVPFSCNVQNGILSVAAKGAGTAGVTYDVVVFYTKDG